MVAVSHTVAVKVKPPVTSRGFFYAEARPTLTLPAPSPAVRAREGRDSGSLHPSPFKERESKGEVGSLRATTELSRLTPGRFEPFRIGVKYILDKLTSVMLY